MKYSKGLEEKVKGLGIKIETEVINVTTDGRGGGYIGVKVKVNGNWKVVFVSIKEIKGAP